MVSQASVALPLHTRTYTDAELYDLRPHQVEALNKLANGKILWGGVGTGKSRVAAAYYAKNEAPKDVIVITTAKKRDSFDWQEEFYRIGIGPKSGPNIPGGDDRGRAGSRKKVSSTDETHGVHHGSKGRGRSKESRPADDFLVGRPHDNDAEVPSRRGSQGGGDSETSRGAREFDARSGSHSAAAYRERVSDEHLLGHDGGRGIGSSGNGGFDSGAYPWVLTVDSWNNIAKYADIAGAFFIFDEQRLVGSGDWTRKFLRIAKHNNWILLSGTPGDTWLDYIPVFVANNFYKNRTAFKREHVVYNTFTKFPKVDRYIGVGKLVRHRRELLVEMPYLRHTTRHVVEVELHYDKELLDRVIKDRWNIYTNKPLRDVAEMFSVGRRLINSDPSRLEKVKELWMKHPKLIVFYNFNYELEILRTLVYPNSSSNSLVKSSAHGKKMSSVGVANDSKVLISSTSALKTKRRTTDLAEFSTSQMSIAEWNGHKHEPIPSSTRWLYLVQYTAGAEGWNCIETDATVMYSRNYSWKILEQSMGRIDRLNTPFRDLWYYDLMSNSFIDRAIGRSLRAKETFNEAKYKGLFK